MPLVHDGEQQRHSAPTWLSAHVPIVTGGASFSHLEGHFSGELISYLAWLASD